MAQPAPQDPPRHACPPVLQDPPHHAAPPSPVLIIGAGIVGLTLAQALRTFYPHVPFLVFERDASPLARGAGWGLTLHWALDHFLSLLPQHLVERLDGTFVDPDAARAGDGKFQLFDLRSGQVRWSVPPSRRIRVKRESLRRLLMDGIDVQWSKSIASVTTTTTGVTVHFEDSTSASGALLLGCDGSRSRTRQILCPAAPRNTPLPVRLLGTSFACGKAKAEGLQKLDPFFFQGSDGETDAFLYFSFLDTPASAPRKEGRYTCQCIVSWPYRAGFNGEAAPTDIPTSNAARLALMRALSAGWTEPFRSILTDVPATTEARAITLEDWAPTRDKWDNTDGRITLLGDAAHAMTMYRGEAANHGIMDVKSLLANLELYLSTSGTSESQSSKSLKDGIAAYEEEMIARTRPAVLASRRACLDAHDRTRLTPDSPLLSKRAVVPDE
ncbi:MAG: hypothetical protein M1838_002655 [Thelocarpon superellum]|nr:MAG: hypothetical protein M1838_002655 [Thelocarpon superellum]